MAVAAICSIIFALLAIIIIVRRIYNVWKYLGIMKKIPSTKTHFLFGHLDNFFFRKKEDYFYEAVNIMDRGGSCSVFWLGIFFPALCIHKAEHIQKLLASPTNIEKPIQYSFISHWIGTGLLISSGKKWQSRRKLTTPAFHYAILEKFLEVFAEKTQILVKILERELESGFFDIVPYVSACTLDIICETAMGLEMNMQEDDQNLEYREALKRMTDDVGDRTLQPWLYPDFIYFLTPRGRRHMRDAKTVQSLTKKVIQEKQQSRMNNRKMSIDKDADLGLKKKQVFLDHILEAAENGYNLTAEDIREEVDTFLFGGHDTIAASLSFALRELASHPEVQEKIVQEQEEIFHGSYRTPTTKDLSEMKYLEMVIKECLRLHPPVPLIARYTSEDIEIGGYIVPAGTMIAIPIYLTHRDPEQFPNPDTFNPENFLPEKIAARHPMAYIPFSAGPRNCVGQKYATMEMKVMMSYILRNYVVELAGPNPIIELTIVMNSINGVQLKIKRRTS